MGEIGSNRMSGPLSAPERAASAARVDRICHLLQPLASAPLARATGAARTPRPAASDPGDAFPGKTCNAADYSTNARPVFNDFHDHGFWGMHFAGDKVLERLLPALLDRFHGRLHSDAAEHASYTLSTEALYGLGDYPHAWQGNASQESFSGQDIGGCRAQKLNLRRFPQTCQREMLLPRGFVAGG